MLIIPTENSFEFVMEVRSSKLKHHRGEISFPGGRFDKDLDGNLEDTAIRETFEEIGISREQITILGLLNNVPVFTGYIIHPIVGVLSYLLNLMNFILKRMKLLNLFKFPLIFYFKKIFSRKCISKHTVFDIRRYR